MHALKPLSKILLIVTLLFGLTACGGGGGGGVGSSGGGTATLAWQGATPIESETGRARSPDIAYAANEQAMAVWLQDDGTRDNVWANRIDTIAKTLGTPTLIETGIGAAYHPKVAYDADGNAIAVWYQLDGGRTDIWANRFTASTLTWGTAELIESNDVGDALAPQIAIDANGNALVVWFQNDTFRNNIWANRYDASTGWGTVELIETDDAGGASSPQVVFDANGNALAVWDQSDGTRDNIWANRYDASTGWGTTELIESINTGNAGDPQPAFDGDGNAFVVWQLRDGLNNNIWVNRYSAGTDSWGAPSLLETDDTGSANFPQVTMDASGFAWAVWQQSDGTRDNIWSNRYDSSTGLWGMAELVEIDSGFATAPQLAMNSDGDTVVVWEQTVGSSDNIMARYFDSSTGTWNEPELIESDAGDGSVPQVAMHSNGNAVAVWRQDDGTGNEDILANILTP